MKRTIAILSFMLTLFGATAQNTYWIFLVDKAGTAFDPYTYFDAKAIERYTACGADLYDISNYPLTRQYVDGVVALATEEVGCSRWMNAVGVVATPDEANAIARLPYVTRVQPIESNMQLAAKSDYVEQPGYSDISDTTLTDQLLRMQGQLFRQKGIDGKGVRIAVFDGGFPRVNTHAAFKHLRDNHQILKTWNFPNHKENVYGWNSHGTMTLSCIAGRMDGRDLGLATGAEFLLARTEVEPEPFKEEIWWQQAVEWADRNGANIISSSLGYGKDRYYTRDMDGTSYVAKAANLAARKGILVVNSAGNEADDKSWQYIITPSDADSVLCIGGITHSLTDYEHISFASFGPSADGRQKPNLCAFAHTWAANPKNDEAYSMVYGTSFSCPLVAGFAACAWQASKGKTNMEMFQLIQRSGDLYPYCDYAFGYGVPQAAFFVGGKTDATRQQDALFRLEPQGDTAVCVRFTRTDSNVHIFYKDLADDGSILTYGKRTLASVDTAVSLRFLGGRRLVVFCQGQMEEYRFPTPTEVADKYVWCYLDSPDGNSESDYLARTPRFDIPNERRAEWDYYFSFGEPIALGDELACHWYSPAWRLGMRWQHHFSKAYGIGIGIEFGHVAYRYNGMSPNALEQQIMLHNTVSAADNRIFSRKLNVSEWSLELFQRVRFLPAGLMHKGLHWDLGAYATFAFNNYYLLYSNSNDQVAGSRELCLHGLNPLAGHHLLYGVTTRLTYDIIGIYARYRLTGIGQTLPADRVLLPRLELGIQLLL